MAKIVIDARESGTSTGRYIDKLVENLHALNPPEDFLVLTKPKRVEYIKKIAPGFGVEKCEYREFSFGEQYGYAWQLFGIKNTLVHFGMTQQPVLYFANKVTTIHDLTTARFRNPAKKLVIFKIKQFVYKQVIKSVAKRSSAIITPSEYVKKDLAEFAGINSDKIKVTYEAADKITEKPNPITPLLNTEYLLYVGRPQPHKNLWRLVEAFEIVKQTHPNLKLVLAGKADVLYNRLHRKAEKKGIEGVLFTGFVGEAELRWLYENCQAYVFPSLSEGFGLPGLEAMIHGAPVVSSNATSLPEIYGKAAHYFDPLSVDDMAKKISEVLDNKSLRTKLIKAGKARAEKYSWKKMAEQTLEVYRQATPK